MADKTYTLEIIAKGLKEVTKGIEQLNAETAELESSQAGVQKGYTKTGKLMSNHQTGMKGVSNATSGGTKAFSKMAETMDGTLVPAYATVAANVFALTAAFGALERAADLQILIESSEALAVQTGRNLVGLATVMKEVTGNAISMKEALQSASIAASAGFDNSTIKELTQVARNASVALGREMTDSLNRVFKGAIKAEPELLDELGIILRLDTAARKYAATLGKTASSLTTFEKQQAVVNDVIEQGQKKFGRLSEVDPNPYTQLAAAFKDVSAALISFISTPVTPVIQFFTENIASLTAALVLFSTSVLKRAFPALTKLQDALDTGFGKALNSLTLFTDKISKTGLEFLSKAAKRDLDIMSLTMRDIVDESAAGLENLGKTGTKTFNELKNGALNTRKEAEKFIKSYRSVAANLRAGIDSQGLIGTTENADILDNAINKVQSSLDNLGDSAERNLGNKLVNVAVGPAKLVSTALTGLTSTLNLMFKSFVSGIANVNEADNAFVGFGQAIKEAGREAGFFAKSFAKVSAGLGGTVSLLFKAIPIIGSLTIAWQILGSAIGFVRDLFIDEDIIKLNESLETLDDTLISSSKSIIFYNKNLRDSSPTISNLVDEYTSMANILGEVSSALKEVNSDLQAQEEFGFFTNIADFFNIGELDATKEIIEDLVDNLNNAGFSNEVQEVLENFGSIGFLSGDEVTNLTKALTNLTNELNIGAQGAKDYADGLKNVSVELNKTFDEIIQGLPTLSGTEKAIVQMQELLALTAITSGTLSSAIDNASDSLIFSVGLKEQADRITETTRLIKNYENRVKDLTKQIKELSEASRVAGDDPESQTVIDIRAIVILEEELSSATDNLEYLIKLRDENEAKGSNFLENEINNLEKFNSSLKDLNLQRLELDIAKNYFSNVEQFISTLTKSTDIEIKSIKILTGQLKDQKSITENIIKELLDDQGKLTRLGKDNLSKTQLGEFKNITDNLRDQRSRLAQLNKGLLQNLDAEAKVYLKTLNTVEKELQKQIVLSGKGSVTAASNIDLLEKEFTSAAVGFQSAFNSINKSIQITDEEITGLIEEFINFSSFNFFISANKLRDIGTVINSAFSLEKSILEAEIITNEYQKLIDLGQTLQDQFGSVDLLGIAKIDSEIEALFNRFIDQENILLPAEYEKIAKLLAELENERELIANKRLAEAEKELVIITDTLNIKNKNLAKEVAFGAFITKQEKRRVEFAKQREKFDALGIDTTDLEIAQDIANDLQNKLDFSDQLRKGAERMNELADATATFFENLKSTDFQDNLVAPLLLLQRVGENMDSSLGDLSTGFATLGLAIEGYTSQLENIRSNDELSKENKLLAKQQAAYSLIGNAAGAMAGAFEEGSSAAKVFTLVAQGAAIASAAQAVATAGTGEPFSGLVRAAAMLSLMASVLGAAGIAFGGSSSSESNTAQAYQDRLGSDRLLDRDLQSNALVDSLDQLIEIDTALFGAVRDLQISMSKLSKVFDRLGAQVFGTFTGTDVRSLELIGTSTDVLTPDLAKAISKSLDFATLGLASGLLDSFFGTTEIETTILDAGIQFKTLIESSAEGLTGSFEELTRLNRVLVKETTEKYFGLSSSTSTSIRTIIDDLPLELVAAMETALTTTFDVINGLVLALADSVGNIDLASLFSGVFVDVGEEFISLFELSAEDSSEAIAQFFSALTTDVLESTLPFLNDYRSSGEELADTLIRVTTEILTVAQALRTVGLEFENFVQIGTISFPPLMEAFNNEINNLVSSASSGDRRLSLTVSTIRPDTATNAQLEQAFSQEVEAFKLKVATAWTDALLSEFIDTDQFLETFEKFASAIFDETELLDFSLNNAIDVVEFGFGELINLANDMGRTDLADIITDIGDRDPAEALREFYEQALSTDAFSAIVTELNGDINTLGATMLSTVTRLGSSVADLQALERQIQNLIEEIDNLNEKYIQQIALFGKLGKEAELLSLAFDFNAAIKEAEETGSNIALVEEAYGLERLQIIKNAFEQIEDEITGVMDSIVSSTITIAQNSDAWDDIAFSVIRINKLVTQLSKGTSGINLTSLIGDTSDFDDFIDNFQHIIDTLSEEGPGTVSDEIQLVDELRQAILDRYSAETALIEDQIDAFKDLSQEIQNYLDDLIISDRSPLTNFERLNEAQDQFLQNAVDVFSEDADIAANAASNLLSSADSLLEVASTFFAIGPEYLNIFNLVTGVLEDIDSTLIEQLNADPTVTQLEDLNATATEQLALLDSVLLELQAQNEVQLATDIAANITEGMMPLIDDVINKLQSIDDGSWTTIIGILEAINQGTIDTINAIESISVSGATAEINTVTGEISNLEDFNSLVDSTTPSFNIGSYDVPQDMLAKIHEGETIIPKPFAESVREGEITIGKPQEIGKGIQEGSVNLIPTQDNTDVVEAIRELTQVLAISQEDIVEATSKNIEASRDIATSVVNLKRQVSTKEVA